MKKIHLMYDLLINCVACETYYTTANMTSPIKQYYYSLYALTEPIGKIIDSMNWKK